MEVQPLTQADREWVEPFIHGRWGANFVVAHGVIYIPHELAGFAAREEAQVLGLVTYQVEAASCEIVTLDSARPSRGVGTALVEAVREAASRAGCTRLWLITTNDNLNALRFYQKRGFELVAVHRRALEKSRALKPSIPLTGQEGIPLRDELELERLLAPAQHE